MTPIYLTHPLVSLLELRDLHSALPIQRHRPLSELHRYLTDFSLSDEWIDLGVHSLFFLYKRRAYRSEETLKVFIPLPKDVPGRGQQPPTSTVVLPVFRNCSSCCILTLAVTVHWIISLGLGFTRIRIDGTELPWSPATKHHLGWDG